MNKRDKHFSPPNPLLMGGRGWKIVPEHVKCVHNSLKYFYEALDPIQYKRLVEGEWVRRKEAE